MRQRTSRRVSNYSYSVLEPRQLLASIGFESGEVVVQGDASADLIELTGSADFRSFTVRINNDASLTETFQYSEVDSLTVFAGGGNDQVFNTLLIDTEIHGGAGDDFIQGGFFNDMLFGGSGTDTLVGRHGRDTIRGQDGSDFVFGGPGSDQLFGSAGNDRLFGGTGSDSLVGDAGDDELRGEDGDDRLVGGPGANRLFGEAGNDELLGGNENDVLVGGLGSDRLVGNAGNDLLNGNEGSDTIFGGLGDDRVNGGLGDDTILGNAGTNELNGNGGQDQINGGTGADRINGGSGNDRLAGGDGEDRISGNDGADTLFGGAGDDFLFGGRGDDFLAGQDGDDSLNGELAGAAGAGRGENVLFGNDGDDRFFPQNNTRIVGGEGVDSLSAFGRESEFRLDPVGSSFQLTDLRDPSRAFWQGQINLTSIEQFTVTNEDDPIPADRLLTNPIVQQIIIQPVVVADDDGSNLSNAFGNADDEAEIKRIVNRIFNQAGVEVEFLPTRQFNSTFANNVDRERDAFDLREIIRRGDAAGIGSSDPLVIDYYFVNTVPGFDVRGGGRGFVGQSGAAQSVSEFNSLFMPAFGFASTAETFAHEVGHNLGLNHTSERTLLSIGAENRDSVRLTAGQIEQVLASNITRPVLGSSANERTQASAQVRSSQDSDVSLGTSELSTSGGDISDFATAGSSATIGQDGSNHDPACTCIHCITGR